MITQTNRTRIAVVVFALTALGALAVSPRTASTQEQQTYSDGYNKGYRAGVNEQKKTDQRQQQQEQDTGEEKGGCCGGGSGG